MTDKLKRKNKFKMWWVYLFVLILAGGSFIQILNLIFFQRSLYEGTSAKCLDKTKDNWKSDPLASDTTCNCFVVQNDLMPTRGEIYDDLGRLLISNFNVFDITVDGRMLEPKITKKGQKEFINDTIYCGNNLKISRSNDHVKLDRLIDDLAHSFYQLFKNRFPDKTVDFYKKRFTEAIKEKKNIQILRSNINQESKWITDDDTAQIAKMPLLSRKRHGGLNYTVRIVRINPYGEMAKRVLGKYTDDRRYGLETAFNKELSGEMGAQKFLYVNKARIPLNHRIDPKDGFNIHSTLNLEIQNIVHNELLQTLIELNAEWGCAVVMETKTGEVKAMSNLTRSKYANRYVEGEQNYALTAMVEPGSTFKLASLLAYLERTPNDNEKKYPLYAHTFTRKGNNKQEYKYSKNDGINRDEESGYPIEVFQRSSNVGIASMIFDKFSIYDYQNYLQKIDSLFITTSFTTQLGQINAPNIKRKANDFHTYYNTCFGTGFKMTPIQSLIYFNAVANNGKMVLPLFVKYITHRDDTIKRFHAEVITENIAKETTIKRAQNYLQAVVTGDHGTARYYANSSFSFAGKTGTRDIWDETTQSYVKHKNSVSFCGYFPTEEPIYTAIVFIYNVPRKSSIAVKVFTGIEKAIINSAHQATLQEIQHEEKQLPTCKVTATEDLVQILETFEIKRNLSSSSIPYVSVYSDDKSKNQITQIPFVNKKKEISVLNFNASDAIFELSKLGLKTKIEGKGKVYKQEYDWKNKSATLYLKP